MESIQNMEISSSDNELEEEWNESGNSLEDVNLYETRFCETDVVNIGDLNVGDYVIIRFLGGKRYRYTCVIQNIYVEDNGIEVMSDKSLDHEKILFKPEEKDITVMSFSYVIGRLSPPDISISSW